MQDPRSGDTSDGERIAADREVVLAEAIESGGRASQRTDGANEVAYAEAVTDQPQRRRGRRFRLGAIGVGAVLSLFFTFGFSHGLRSFGLDFTDIDPSLWALGTCLARMMDFVAGYVTARMAGTREYLHAWLAAVLAAALLTAYSVIFQGFVLPGMGFAGNVSVALLSAALSSFELFALMLGGAFYAVTVRLAVEQRHAGFLMVHGCVSILFGAMVLGGCLLVLAASTRFLADVPIFLVMLYFGGHSLTEGVRWLRSRQWYRADHRKPVVMLRSFADDAIELPLAWWERLLPWKYLPAILRIHHPLLEESVVTCLARTGPVFAVADPQYGLFTLGAIRRRLDDSNWQEKVAEFIDDSQLVAMILGQTMGLRWEIQELVRKRALQRTLFVIPPMSHRNRSLRWQTFCYLLGRVGIRGLPREAPRDALCARLDERNKVQFFCSRGFHGRSYAEAIETALRGTASRAIQPSATASDPSESSDQPSLPSRIANPTVRGVVLAIGLVGYAVFQAATILQAGEAPFMTGEEAYVAPGRRWPADLSQEEFDMADPNAMARFWVAISIDGHAEELLRDDPVFERLRFGPRHRDVLLEELRKLRRYQGREVWVEQVRHDDRLSHSVWSYYLVDAEGRQLEGTPWIGIFRDRQLQFATLGWAAVGRGSEIPPTERPVVPVFPVFIAFALLMVPAAIYETRWARRAASRSPSAVSGP